MNLKLSRHRSANSINREARQAKADIEDKSGSEHAEGIRRDSQEEERIQTMLIQSRIMASQKGKNLKQQMAFMVLSLLAAPSRLTHFPPRLNL